MKFVIRDQNQKPEETRTVWLEEGGSSIHWMTEIDGRKCHLCSMAKSGRLYLHTGIPEDAGFTLDSDGCIEILN